MEKETDDLINHELKNDLRKLLNSTKVDGVTHLKIDDSLIDLASSGDKSNVELAYDILKSQNLLDDFFIYAIETPLTIQFDTFIRLYLNKEINKELNIENTKE